MTHRVQPWTEFPEDKKPVEIIGKLDPLLKWAIDSANIRMERRLEIKAMDKYLRCAEDCESYAKQIPSP